jgi:hypothetical protein
LNWTNGSRSIDRAAAAADAAIVLISNLRRRTLFVVASRRASAIGEVPILALALRGVAFRKRQLWSIAGEEALALARLGGRAGARGRGNRNRMPGLDASGSNFNRDRGLRVDFCFE